MSTKSRRLRDKHANDPTIIAKTTVFLGNIKSSAPVIVYGMIEGNCEVENIITITESGTWIGNIRAKCVIVDGKIKGNVNTEGKLELGETSQIHGDVTSGSMAIATGAVIEGDMRVIEQNEPHHFEEKRASG